jgi:proline dehydrogenase
VPDLRIELLTTPDCPHAAPSRELLLSVLEHVPEPQDLSFIEVGDESAAASYGFHGSPTIRVAGRDIVEPDGEVGLACRRYRQVDGSMDGVPPRAAIEEAIGAWRAARTASAAPPPRRGIREVPAKVMRAGFLWASRRRSLERIATGNRLTRRLVQRFVAGSTLAEAADVLASLHTAGYATTVDVLGESVDSKEAARAAADAYMDVLRTLVERGLDGNVSLKLTQMGLDLDRGFCVENVRRVVDEAARSGAFVRVDMEDHTRTDATLAVARELHAAYPEVGVVIQSYLRRSAEDIEALIAQGIRVRLCKGAYNEPSDVAFPSKAEVDDSYVALMERLLRDGRYPAIATHDERILRRAVRFARREGIGPERFEFQMLYGIRRDLQERLTRAGWTVRVYTPYGHEWYPYFMRRLAERPANLLFILRNVVRDRGSSSRSV